LPFFIKFSLEIIIAGAENKTGSDQAPKIAHSFPSRSKNPDSSPASKLFL